jgi:ribosomal protein L37AE/L43A
MKCRFGHAHPPKLLKAATGNPAEPRGPRPFHCPDCQQVTMARTASGSWRVYQTPAEARAAGHLWPCKSCFG